MTMMMSIRQAIQHRPSVGRHVVCRMPRHGRRGGRVQFTKASNDSTSGERFDEEVYDALCAAKPLYLVSSQQRIALPEVYTGKRLVLALGRSMG